MNIYVNTVTNLRRYTLLTTFALFSSTVNPFVGVPLGNMLLPEFYYPISYPIRVAAIPQLSDGDIVVTVQPDGHTPSVNPVIDTYSHGATISYDNALNSLNGAYIITVNVSGPAPFSETIYLNISVLGNT